MTKTLISAALVLAAASGVARADDCLEVGWRDSSNNWTYYRAWIDSEDGNKLQLHYDYMHGTLELKVFEKERGDGANVIVLRGHWYDQAGGKRRSGRVRMELEKGRHRAKGWYTWGDEENATHYDFALRDCRR